MKNRKTGERAGSRASKVKVAGGQVTFKEESKDRQRILIEFRVEKGLTTAAILAAVEDLNESGIELDASYEPVPISPHPDSAAIVEAANQQVVIVRGITN